MSAEHLDTRWYVLRHVPPPYREKILALLDQAADAAQQPIAFYPEASGWRIGQKLVIFPGGQRAAIAELYRLLSLAAVGEAGGPISSGEANRIRNRLRRAAESVRPFDAEVAGILRDAVVGMHGVRFPGADRLVLDSAYVSCM